MLNETLKIDNFSNDQLFELIFKIVELDKLNSQTEADNFINYLTCFPAPIREAIAYKLEEMIKNYPDFFKSSLAEEKMLNAITDINPNVSRVMCEIIKNNEFVSGMLIQSIITKILDTLSKIKEYEEKNREFFKNKITNKKNHAKNKLLFSLYWCLEALSGCDISKYEDNILKILNCTIDFYDYTIREKTAKLLNKIKNPPLELLRKATSDQNFYVKIQVYDKMNFEDLN